MENCMKKIAGCVFLCLCAVCFHTLAQASLITLALEPSSVGAPPVGSVVTFELRASGLADDLSLSVFDLNITYDPSVLSIASVIFGDPDLGDQLDPDNLADSITSYISSNGVVNLYGLSMCSAANLENSQEDSFILATLGFTVVAPGYTDLNIAVNALGDSEANSLSGYTKTVGAAVGPAVSGIITILLEE
jgi:hypothetical protein